jgi:hypothetical protein
MNLFLFLLVIAVSFLVVRIGGIAFELTGMERDQARFQSLSCFTGTGFTTAEAELITTHPQRRKIASYLMILGNAGLVTLIATFANSIRPVTVIEQFNLFTIPLPIPAQFSPYINISIIAVGTYIIYKIFTRSRLIDRFLVKIKNRLAEKEIIKPEKVLDLLVAAEGYGLSQFEIQTASPLMNKTLMELKLKQLEVQVLMIKRDGQNIIIPKGDAVLAVNDKLICFGRLEKIRELAKT